MNDLALIDQLNTLLGTELRSLARHIDEAKPFLTAQTYRAWSAVHHMSLTSEEHAHRLTALLEAMDESPNPGSFETDVANYHYMSLESLLPLLIEEKQRQVKNYQTAVGAAGSAGGDPSVAAELQSLLAENQSMLVQLQSMVGAPGSAAANPSSAAPAHH